MQLTVHDVAKLLNVGDNAVHHWVADDRLPATEINGQYRFNCAEVLEWATARNMALAPAAFPYSSGRDGEQTQLAAALRLGGVLHDVPGTDKESVLRHIIQAMPLPDEMEREFLLQVFLSREAVGSTNVGDGIAMPHPRYPNVVQIADPFITLAFLKEPIVYAATDKQPVHTMFALVSPTVRNHLGLLAVLATALRDPEFRQLVAARRSADEIVECAAQLETTFRLNPALVRPEVRQ